MKILLLTILFILYFSPSYSNDNSNSLFGIVIMQDIKEIPKIKNLKPEEYDSNYVLYNLNNILSAYDINPYFDIYSVLVSKLDNKIHAINGGKLLNSFEFPSYLFFFHLLVLLYYNFLPLIG